VDDEDGSGRDCSGIDVRMDAAKLTNMIIAGFSKRDGI